ncbi:MULTISPECIES: hypothetical protein [Sphingobium]|jgi:hypothetical protein|uniref:Uncharacterized protein n=1 Tax=Sphingobium limneticum TaxID=1007511 RepID=A0A5J5I7J0_9SPHN|nr:MULTISPECIES: hypothetical protein [Sphingobium]KAA9019082.1 hypothetical protein F4U94_02785 [Sphingobium limneticum]KAA9019602.1 hypothetical protein F4U96_04945 [Sphingobium limneticum]KAA9032060.1 hypothetical protein F4U95_04945 [Sphingobium limneticum]MBU0932820.1 hypothetical protein [Alphaproteobacteria bacterium]
MAKMKVDIVDGPIDLGKPGKPKYRTVHKDGKVVKLRVVDADSPNFGAEFLASFKASVRKAREENRAIKAKD